MSFLNKEQQNIVDRPIGHDIVLSGPGTGKTTTLSHRIIYLIKELNVKPSSIVVLSYTVEAAKNIINRTAKLGLSKEEKEDILSGTIHSFCLKQLLDYTGRKDDHKVLADKQDIARFQYDFIDGVKNETFKHIVSEEDWNFLTEIVNTSVTMALTDVNPYSTLIAASPEMSELINELKFSGLINSIIDNSHQIIEHVETGNREIDRDNQRRVSQASSVIQNSAMYRRLSDIVLQIMINQGIYTYDTMISCYHRLIHDPENQDYFTDMKSPIYYLAVDEFQDLEPNHFEIISRLSSNIRGSMLIGDIWQSIYQFKLSLPAYRHIVPFSENDPFVKLVNSSTYNIIPLIHSFRSTRLNTSLANKMREALYNKFFKGRLTEKIEISRKVISVSKEIGNKPKLIYGYNFTEEAIQGAINSIKSTQPKTNAILFRTNTEMRKAVDIVKRSGRKSTVEFVDLLKYKEFMIAKILFNHMIETGSYLGNESIRLLSKAGAQNYNFTIPPDGSIPKRYTFSINTPTAKSFIGLLSLYTNKPKASAKATFEVISGAITKNTALTNETTLSRVIKYSGNRNGTNNQALHLLSQDLMDLWNENKEKLNSILNKDTTIDKILNFFIHLATNAEIYGKPTIITKDIKDFIKSVIISSTALEFSGKNMFGFKSSYNEKMFLKRIDKPFKDGYFTLNTMHKSKGLEWDDVHLVMPVYIVSRIIGNASQTKFEEFLEYVSFTRAKKNVFIHVYNSTKYDTEGIQNFLPARNVGNPVFYMFTKHLGTQVSIDNSDDMLINQLKVVTDKDIKTLNRFKKFVDFVQYTPPVKIKKQEEEV